MITSALAGNLEVSVNSQVQYVVIGLFMIIGLTIFDYHYLDAMSGLLYFGIIVLLFALNIFGQAQFGAARWLRIGPFQLQPSEFAKAVLIIRLAKYFSDRWYDPHDMRWILTSFGLRAFFIRQNNYGKHQISRRRHHNGAANIATLVGKKTRLEHEHRHREVCRNAP